MGIILLGYNSFFRLWLIFLTCPLRLRTTAACKKESFWIFISVFLWCFSTLLIMLFWSDRIEFVWISSLNTPASVQYLQWCSKSAAEEEVYQISQEETEVLSALLVKLLLMQTVLELLTFSCSLTIIEDYYLQIDCGIDFHRRNRYDSNIIFE